MPFSFRKTKKAQTASKPKARAKPAWDNSIHDIASLKLSKEELLQRKQKFTSKNKDAAKKEVERLFASPSSDRGYQSEPGRARSKSLTKSQDASDSGSEVESPEKHSSPSLSSFTPRSAATGTPLSSRSADLGPPPRTPRAGSNSLNSPNGARSSSPAFLLPYSNPRPSSRNSKGMTSGSDSEGDILSVEAIMHEDRSPATVYHSSPASDPRASPQQRMDLRSFVDNWRREFTPPPSQSLLQHSPLMTRGATSPKTDVVAASKPKRKSSGGGSSRDPSPRGASDNRSSRTANRSAEKSAKGGGSRMATPSPPPPPTTNRGRNRDRSASVDRSGSEGGRGPTAEYHRKSKLTTVEGRRTSPAGGSVDLGGGKTKGAKNAPQKYEGSRTSMVGSDKRLAAGLKERHTAKRKNDAADLRELKRLESECKELEQRLQRLESVGGGGGGNTSQSGEESAEETNDNGRGASAGNELSDAYLSRVVKFFTATIERLAAHIELFEHERSDRERESHDTKRALQESTATINRLQNDLVACRAEGDVLREQFEQLREESQQNARALTAQVQAVLNSTEFQFMSFVMKNAGAAVGGGAPDLRPAPPPVMSNETNFQSKSPRNQGNSRIPQAADQRPNSKVDIERELNFSSLSNAQSDTGSATNGKPTAPSGSLGVAAHQSGNGNVSFESEEYLNDSFLEEAVATSPQYDSDGRQDFLTKEVSRRSWETLPSDVRPEVFADPSRRQLRAFVQPSSPSSEPREFHQMMEQSPKPQPHPQSQPTSPALPSPGGKPKPLEAGFVDKPISPQPVVVVRHTAQVPRTSPPQPQPRPLPSVQISPPPPQAQPLVPQPGNSPPSSETHSPRSPSGGRLKPKTPPTFLHISQASAPSPPPSSLADPPPPPPPLLRSPEPSWEPTAGKRSIPSFYVTGSSLQGGKSQTTVRVNEATSLSSRAFSTSSLTPEKPASPLPPRSPTQPQQDPGTAKRVVVTSTASPAALLGTDRVVIRQQAAHDDSLETSTLGGGPLELSAVSSSDLSFGDQSIVSSQFDLDSFSPHTRMRIAQALASAAADGDGELDVMNSIVVSELSESDPATPRRIGGSSR